MKRTWDLIFQLYSINPSIKTSYGVGKSPSKAKMMAIRSARQWVVDTTTPGIINIIADIEKKRKQKKYISDELNMINAWLNALTVNAQIRGQQLPL